MQLPEITPEFYYPVIAEAKGTIIRSFGILDTSNEKLYLLSPIGVKEYERTEIFEEWNIYEPDTMFQYDLRKLL